MKIEALLALLKSIKSESESKICPNVSHAKNRGLVCNAVEGSLILDAYTFFFIHIPAQSVVRVYQDQQGHAHCYQRDPRPARRSDTRLVSFAYVHVW